MVEIYLIYPWEMPKINLWYAQDKMTALWTNDNSLFMRNSQKANQNDSMISLESDKIIAYVSVFIGHFQNAYQTKLNNFLKEIFDSKISLESDKMTALDEMSA